MDQELTAAVVRAAEAAGIPSAALLAVVEVESAGQALEQDGRTPRFLFERHQFHKWLQQLAPEVLPAAIAAGLAIPKWSRATQYKDQGRSAQRLALLQRARALHAECANLSCSWGIGQTMGFCAPELGFKSATAMVDWMTAGGIDAQIDAMVREITRKGLVDELQRDDWAGFAKAYNGPGYRANLYDDKLRAAEARWDAGGATAPLSRSPLQQVIPEFELRAVQQRLLELGYYKGAVDGLLGNKTIGAVSAFQASSGLTVDGLYGPATRAALASAKAPAAQPTLGRATANARDLRQMGSGTVKMADRLSLGAKLLVGLGLGGLGEQAGVLGGLGGALETVSTLRPLVDALGELVRWATANWSLLAVLAGGVGVYYAAQIVKRRVDQYRADANV